MPQSITADHAATRSMVVDGKCDISAISAVSRNLISLDYKYAAGQANVYKLRCALSGMQVFLYIHYHFASSLIHIASRYSAATRFLLTCAELSSLPRPSSLLQPLISKNDDKVCSHSSSLLTAQGVANSCLRIPSPNRVNVDALRGEAEAVSVRASLFAVPPLQLYAG